MNTDPLGLEAFVTMVQTGFEKNWPIAVVALFAILFAYGLVFKR